MTHIISTLEEFQTTVLSDTAWVVLVDFFAEWCGPCKALIPVMEQLATEYAGRATIVKIDVDELTELAGQYDVMSIPTVIIFKHGIMFGEASVGAFPPVHYQWLIDSALA